MYNYYFHIYNINVITHHKKYINKFLVTGADEPTEKCCNNCEEARIGGTNSWRITLDQDLIDTLKKKFPTWFENREILSTKISSYAKQRSFNKIKNFALDKKLLPTQKKFPLKYNSTIPNLTRNCKSLKKTNQGKKLLDFSNITFSKKFFVCNMSELAHENEHMLETYEQGHNSPKAVVDSSPLQTAMDKNKESLKVKLLLRRPHSQLVEQGIIPSLKMSPAIHEQCKQLDRAKKSDMLKAKIQQRPNREDLERRHILEENDSHIDPSLVEKQRMLKKARLADHLNLQIQQRPGPLELIKKNILHTEKRIEKIVKEGLIPFKATCEGLQSGPQLPLSYVSFEDESQHSENDPIHTFVCEDGKIFNNVYDKNIISGVNLVEASNCEQLTVTPIKNGELKALQTSPNNTVIDTAITAHNIFLNSLKVNQSQREIASPQEYVEKLDTLNKDKYRKKFKSKPIVKSRTIKFHEYKGPPSALQKGCTESISTEETSYQLMLKQQNCLLKFLETLNKDQYSGTVSLQGNIIPKENLNISKGETSLSLSANHIIQPLKTSLFTPFIASGANCSVPCDPDLQRPAPIVTSSVCPNSSLNKIETKCSSSEIPKLEKMKVSDLKAQLKRRNLPVSGAKTQLIERLRPYVAFVDTDSANSVNLKVEALPISDGIEKNITVFSKSPIKSTPFKNSQLSEKSNLNQQKIDFLPQKEPSTMFQSQSKTATIIFSNDELLRQQQLKINELQHQLKKSQEELLLIRQKQIEQHEVNLQQIHTQERSNPSIKTPYQKSEPEKKIVFSLNRNETKLQSKTDSSIERNNSPSLKKNFQILSQEDASFLINSQTTNKKMVVKQQLEAKIQKKKENAATLQLHEQENALKQQKLLHLPQIVVFSQTEMMQLNNNQLVLPKKDFNNSEISFNHKSRNNIGFLCNDSSKSLILVNINEKPIVTEQGINMPKIVQNNEKNLRQILTPPNITLTNRITPPIEQISIIDSNILKHTNKNINCTNNITNDTDNSNYIKNDKNDTIIYNNNNNNNDIKNDKNNNSKSNSNNKKEANFRFLPQNQNKNYLSVVSKSFDSDVEIGDQLSCMSSNDNNILYKLKSSDEINNFDSLSNTKLEILSPSFSNSLHSYSDINMHDNLSNSMQKDDINLYKTETDLNMDTLKYEKLIDDTVSFQLSECNRSKKKNFSENKNINIPLECANNIDNKINKIENEDIKRNSDSLSTSLKKQQDNTLNIETSTKSSEDFIQNRFDEYELLELMSQHLEMDIGENTSSLCSISPNEEFEYFQNSKNHININGNVYRKEFKELELHYDQHDQDNNNVVNNVNNCEKKICEKNKRSNSNINKSEDLKKNNDISNINIKEPLKAKSNNFSHTPNLNHSSNLVENSSSFETGQHNQYGDIPMDICDDFLNALENDCFSALSSEHNINMNFDNSILSQRETNDVNCSLMPLSRTANIGNKPTQNDEINDVFDLFNIDDCRSSWNDSNFAV